MEISKEAFIQLKTRIKQLAEEQKVLRPQRKTVHFTGERIMDTVKAQTTHAYNRWELRYLYLAYAVVRGKTIEQVEPHNRADNKANPDRVQNVIQKYAEAVRDNAGRSAAA